MSQQAENWYNTSGYKWPVYPASIYVFIGGWRGGEWVGLEPGSSPYATENLPKTLKTPVKNQYNLELNQHTPRKHKKSTLELQNKKF